VVIVSAVIMAGCSHWPGAQPPPPSPTGSPTPSAQQEIAQLQEEVVVLEQDHAADKRLITADDIEVSALTNRLNALAACVSALTERYANAVVACDTVR
jgi:hypothetical protein